VKDFPPDAAATTTLPVDWQIVGFHLIVAFAGGALVSAIYSLTRPRAQINPSFPPTLVLLSILIAMVTQVIGDQLARAFSLVGVLSIVRFRTVVRDTQDTAFVIFAVVVGMAAGAGSYAVAAVGLIVGGTAAAVVRTKRIVTWAQTESTLNLRVGLGVDPKNLLIAAFEKSLDHHEVISITTVQKGAALDYIYRIRTRKTFEPAAFVKELNQIDGIQSVELRRGEPDDV
jgi:uncharacterized membrane protein YhiD involved in acid resistance